jgi:hypothetical protein
MSIRSIVISLAIPAAMFLARRWVFPRGQVGFEYMLLLGVALPLFTIYVRRRLLHRASEAPWIARRKKLRPSAALVDALESNPGGIVVESVDTSGNSNVVQRKKGSRKGKGKNKRSQQEEPRDDSSSFVSWVESVANARAKSALQENRVLVVCRYFDERREENVSHVLTEALPPDSCCGSLDNVDRGFVDEVVQNTHKHLMKERESRILCTICSKESLRFHLTPNVFPTYILIHPCVPLCGAATCEADLTRFIADILRSVKKE